MLAYSAIKQWGGTYVQPQDGFQHCALFHALYTKVKLATLKKRYCQKEKSHQQGTAIRNCGKLSHTLELQ